MNDNLGVSLVKYLCPICGKEAEEGIIMNTLLTEEHAKAAKELHGKAVGYSKHACKECAKYKDAAIFFIGIDISKSEPNNPYRTGQLTGVKKDSPLVDKVKDYIITLEDNSKYVFIDENLGKQIGLWN